MRYGQECLPNEVSFDDNCPNCGVNMGGSHYENCIGNQFCKCGHSLMSHEGNAHCSANYPRCYCYGCMSHFEGKSNQKGSQNPSARSGSKPVSLPVSPPQKRDVGKPPPIPSRMTISNGPPPLQTEWMKNTDMTGTEVEKFIEYLDAELKRCNEVVSQMEQDLEQKRIIAETLRNPSASVQVILDQFFNDSFVEDIENLPINNLWKTLIDATILYKTGGKTFTESRQEKELRDIIDGIEDENGKKLKKIAAQKEKCASIAKMIKENIK